MLGGRVASKKAQKKANIPLSLLSSTIPSNLSPLRVIPEPTTSSHLIRKFGICPECPDLCLLERRTVTLPD